MRERPIMKRQNIKCSKGKKNKLVKVKWFKKVSLPFRGLLFLLSNCHKSLAPHPKNMTSFMDDPFTDDTFRSIHHHRPSLFQLSHHERSLEVIVFKTPTLKNHKSCSL